MRRATAFGARESVQQISLSPDGNSIAYHPADRGARRLAAMSSISLPGAARSPILNATGNPDRLELLPLVDEYAPGLQHLCDRAERDRVQLGFTRMIGGRCRRQEYQNAQRAAIRRMR